MPVPISFDDLSETPSANSPPGSEPVGTQANEYIQTAFAFIKQLRDGLLKPTAAVDMNGQKLTNGAAATLSTTSKDFVIGSQMYKIGEVRMWHGAVANIASTWGAGWQLADGTNGTADLRDRFIVGAGTSYAVNATGGAANVSLTTAQLPAHSHGINDGGHAHGVADPGHAHGVNDPGHSHSLGSAVPNNIPGNQLALNGTVNSSSVNATQPAGTGISIAGAGTGIGIVGATTGISIQNTGSGTAHENRPPYYALCFIEYVGA
jgi:microcystin-dependent protein